jgi:hypothetical protein
LSVYCNNDDKNFDPNNSIPNFVWEPQEAFSEAPLIFDQSCISSSKSYPESFRGIYQEMTERSKYILKKPEKAEIFKWKPIEDCNLEPRFFKRNFSQP